MEGVRFGESPEQGLTRGQNFYHSGLGIALTAPTGWRIQNAATSLTFVNPKGDAALRMVTLPPKAGSSHDEIIRNAFKPTQGNTTRGQLNGFAATHFVGTNQAANGQAQGVEATIVTGPQQLNYALLYLAASPAARQQAQPGLKAVEQSFRAMSAADTRAARPWQVRVVPFPRGGFAELERQAAPLPQAARQLRLLNGLYGAEADPAVGTPVKVVVEQMRPGRSMEQELHDDRSRFGA